MAAEPTGPAPALMWGRDSAGLSQPDPVEQLASPWGSPTPSKPGQRWEEGKGDGFVYSRCQAGSELLDG